MRTGTIMRSPRRRGSISSPAERVPIVTPQAVEAVATAAQPALMSVGSPPRSLLQKTPERRRPSVSFDATSPEPARRSSVSFDATSPTRTRSGSFAMRTPVRTPERPSPTRPCYHQAESLLLGSLRKSLTISERRLDPPKRRRNSSCCSPWSDDESFIGVTRPSPRRCSGSRSALAAYLAFDSPEPPKRSPFREPPYSDLPGPAPPPPVLGTPVRPRPTLDAYRTPPTRPRPVEAPIAPPVFEPPSDDGASSDDAPPPPSVVDNTMCSPPRPTRPLGPGMEPSEAREALVAFTAAAPTTPRVVRPTARRAVAVDLFASA